MESFFRLPAPPSRGLLPLLAVHVATEFYRLPRKPPVTAALIAVNSLIYTRPGILNSVLPSIDEVWFNPHLILQYADMKRFFLSPFYHVSESHLVYNMVSLLWKGVQLESTMGSAEFTVTVGALLTLSQGITLFLSRALLLVGRPAPYLSHYSTGFSGVLFALKVLLSSEEHDFTYVHGILVPSTHAAWAELILVQMFVPGVSFLGHLGGVLAGILFLRLRGMRPGPTPPAAVLDGLSTVLHWPLWALGGILEGALAVASWPLRVLAGLLPFRRRGFSRGDMGGGHDEPLQWECRACTYNNSGWLGVCEVCGWNRGRAEEMYPPGWLSREELRLRRVQRFMG